MIVKEEEEKTTRMAFCIPAVKFLCDKATKRAAQIGRLNGSIKGGKGNFVGALYELAHQYLFGGKNSFELYDTYDYDFLMPEDWFYGKHGLKLECKAKQRNKFYKLDHEWEGSVAHEAGRGTTQICDVYSHGSVHFNSQNQPTWIWFGGLLPKNIYFEGRSKELQGEEFDIQGRPVKRWKDVDDLDKFIKSNEKGFKEGAMFRREGLVYDYNGFVCVEDCWNQPYSYMDSYRLSYIPEEGRENLKKLLAAARQEERWKNSKTHHLLGIDKEMWDAAKAKSI